MLFQFLRLGESIPIVHKESVTETMHLESHIYDDELIISKQFYVEGLRYL